MKNNIVGVLTTVNEPNQGMIKLLEYASGSETNLIVVGDVKTPNSWAELGFAFMAMSNQYDLFPDFATSLPQFHYSRKNLGYLQAMGLKANWIYETDDDNSPIENPFTARELNVDSDFFSSEGKWLNVYEVFGTVEETKERGKLWPRGFSLLRINDKFQLQHSKMSKSPIQQGLANGDPDVDAIFRLANGSFLNFKNRQPVGLLDSQICPINSQTTFWHKSTFQLMYLPSTCSFRLTDIIRGFVAWRILQDSDEVITFHSPIVYQDRNEHNLLKDFKEEIQLYFYSEEIIEDFLALDLEGMSTSNKLIKLYQVLIKRQIVQDSELNLIQHWNEFFVV
jgi:hypothetical protein